MDPRQDQRRAAAEAAAAEVTDGMAVGLGTGTTIAHFLPALARRELTGLRCVATSPATEDAARGLGLSVQPFDLIETLDVAVDGADQVAPDLWLVKGGGGAHTREKVVAAAAERFIVIVSEEKLVERLRPPIPVEILRFGVRATITALERLGEVRVREGDTSPELNPLADLDAEFDDPAALAADLDAIPGIVGHGLFAPQLVSHVFVGRDDGVDRLSGPRPS